MVIVFGVTTFVVFGAEHLLFFWRDAHSDCGNSTFFSSQATSLVEFSKFIIGHDTVSFAPRRRRFDDLIHAHVADSKPSRSIAAISAATCPLLAA